MTAHAYRITSMTVCWFQSCLDYISLSDFSSLGADKHVDICLQL